MAVIPVVVTGLGVVSALGSSPEELYGRLLNGESGLGPGPWPPARPDQDWWAGQVKGAARSASEMAIAASQQALGSRSAADVWVVCGTSAADMAEGEAAWCAWHRGEPFAAPSLLWPQLPDRPAERVREALGAKPPALAVSTACTAGAVAVQVAADLVRCGRAAAALAVGVDALSQLLWYGFGSLSLQAQGPCRPMDTRRGGLNLGEGAAAILLEPAGGPRRALAILGGAGGASDNFSLVAPRPDGRGARAAIAGALGGRRDPIGWVHAHATGTQQNDQVEAEAILATLPGVPVSGTKGALGHTLGAAGALGAAVAICSLSGGWIPPSVGTESPEAGLDVVLGAPRRLSAPRALSLAFGFGGGGVALCWEAP
ncbi:MAG: hypothetical protein IPN01_09210 [Deltaproteobacteria bacterium]|nr:hypothetical protein [Deltaproteobacteria bacterium]